MILCIFDVNKLPLPPTSALASLTFNLSWWKAAHWAIQEEKDQVLIGMLAHVVV